MPLKKKNTNNSNFIKKETKIMNTQSVLKGDVNSITKVVSKILKKYTEKFIKKNQF